MRTKLITSLFFSAILVLIASQPAAAHHAFGSEFDSNAPVVVRGKIVKIEWVNPHTWIHVEMTKPDGTTETWMFEGGSPNTLLRRGVNKTTFPAGLEVIVDGYQARDHSEKRANARNITFTDGRKIFLGSTGTGAPDPDTFPGTIDKPK